METYCCSIPCDKGVFSQSIDYTAFKSDFHLQNPSGNGVISSITTSSTLSSTESSASEYRMSTHRCLSSVSSSSSSSLSSSQTLPVTSLPSSSLSSLSTTSSPPSSLLPTSHLPQNTTNNLKKPSLLTSATQLKTIQSHTQRRNVNAPPSPLSSSSLSSSISSPPPLTTTTSSSPRPTSTHSSSPFPTTITTITIILLLLLSSTPLKLHAFPIEDNASSEPGVETSQEISGCVGQTGSCVEPILRLLQKRAHLFMAQNMSETEKLCDEYKEVLLCLHFSLAACPSPTNFKRYQDLLSPQSELLFNKLCSIQGTANSGNESSSSSNKGKNSESISDGSDSRSGSIPDSASGNDNSGKLKHKNMTSGKDGSTKALPNNDNENHENTKVGNAVRNSFSTTRKNAKSSDTKKGWKDRGVFDYVDSLTPDANGDTRVTINVVTIIQNKSPNEEGRAGSGSPSALSYNSSASVVGISFLTVFFITIPLIFTY